LEPKSPNDTPVGRANNRRVEILIFQLHERVDPAHPVRSPRETTH
jgi:hypothetical protein